MGDKLVTDTADNVLLHIHVVIKFSCIFFFSSRLPQYDFSKTKITTTEKNNNKKQKKAKTKKTDHIFLINSFRRYFVVVFLYSSEKFVVCAVQSAQHLFAFPDDGQPSTTVAVSILYERVFRCVSHCFGNCDGSLTHIYPFHSFVHLPFQFVCQPKQRRVINMRRKPFKIQTHFERIQ